MIENALSTPEWQKGQFMDTVAQNIDEYSIREPLGVCAHIPPFNFPAMVPFWFWPYAVAAGNTFIVKSNEVCPLAMQLIFECIDKAGFPPGVISYIHGDVEVANMLIDHPLVKTVSSVGSTPVALAIYGRASALGKRAQCHGGANNTLLVMPSANLDEIIPNILNSCFGNSGQRCLAGRTVSYVGDEKKYAVFREKLLKAIKEQVPAAAVASACDADMTPPLQGQRWERVRPQGVHGSHRDQEEPGHAAAADRGRAEGGGAPFA